MANLLPSVVSKHVTFPSHVDPQSPPRKVVDLRVVMDNRPKVEAALYALQVEVEVEAVHHSA
jgi:hypothetical protein